MAPLKALKVNPGSTAHWVAEAQAAIQRGATSARADPKEPVAQGGAAEVTPTPTGEGVLPPCEGEAHESDGAGMPLVAEAPGVSEAEAMEAKVPKTAETAWPWPVFLHPPRPRWRRPEPPRPLRP